ncbi:MAG: hypothetical protein QOK17_1278 [Sphingomonadales bacterium]|jgi:hypothetical protein|nr:hypothetical protein [Sphingomonadales bacterium]
MAYSRIAVRVVAAAGVAAALLGPQSVWGYKIVLPGIHESITRAAIACVRAAQGAEPTYCGDRQPAILKDAYLDPGERYSSVERSTRWSDDPNNAVGSLGIAQYVSRLLVECARMTKPTSRLDEVGLTCSSHFGRLQFMHAQASREPNGTPESDRLTRQKIISWARFAYRVAIEDPALSLDADYCATVRGLEHIGADLAPEGFLQCRKSGQVAWHVASLFNIQCGNIFSWGTCWHRWGPRPNRRAVLLAKGAILHLIQDSYSQSHVYRGGGTAPGPRARFEAKIVCAPARHYYEYNSQAGGHHADADAPPRLDESCRPGAKIDDVITATAKALWQIDHRIPEDKFIEYLETSVLG